MIAKILLTLFAVTGFLFIFTQSAVARTLRFTLYAILSFGLFIIWFPDVSTSIANTLGVGRGADLIFYSWIAFSFGVLLTVHLKLRQQLNLVTKLARYIAIESVVIPDVNRVGETLGFDESPDIAKSPASTQANLHFKVKSALE